MNAVTQIETRAIETAAPLEVADPTKNLILVPLSQLLPRRSKRNARKTPRLSIPELAASIARIGLLQNLVVILSADGEQYEVVAGDRRLTALKLLAKKKRIAVDFEVPCLLVPDASARTVSLAENLLREQMHPADQFEAFAALVKEGRPIEDIAADFGVSPLVVQRRLKLANVSPRLLADYRAAAVTLEQLMALTITDDHAAQEAAFYGAPEWQRGASALRERLTEREIDATHPLVRFAGLDAYTAAGGGIRASSRREHNAGARFGRQVPVIADDRGVHAPNRIPQNVFERSGGRFASRKRVGTRAWSPVPIESERKWLRRMIPKSGNPAFARRSCVNIKIGGGSDST